MANLNRQWKRFMAVGCVHGEFLCQEAARNVLQFADKWKPHERIDLGDVMDFAAFRGGAKGSKDEAANIEDDFNAGAEWLKKYRPTRRCNGNHDDRIYQLLNHQNAIIAHCAGAVVESIRRVDEKNRTTVAPYHQRNGWFQLGDTKFGHGWMFNEMAVRDHAETYGKCVIAHLHRAEEARGRRLDSPVGWCVGTMADPERMTYAHRTRSYLRWGHGMVAGEYCDDRAEVWLFRHQCGNGEAEQWRLPL